MTSGTGRPRRSSPARWPVLALALVAAAALVAASVVEPSTEPTEPTGRVDIEAAWPQTSPFALPSALPDGAELRPAVVLDTRTALVVAPTVDGRFTRLIIWRDGLRFQELRRLPQRDDAGFSAFAALGENIVWAETDGAGAGRIWTADVRQPVAREVTADLGVTSFAGSPHDLVLADSGIHWAAAATDGLRTEVRSVARAGGRVDVQTVNGRWTLSTWPWLTDHREGTAGSSRLLNLHTGQETPVRTSKDDDLAECDPSWCWVWAPSRDGPTRLDVMRPDGTERRTINPWGAEVGTGQVALAERFVVVKEPTPHATTLNSQNLLVYDIQETRTVIVDSAVSEVHAYGTVLWWATGSLTARRWHALELTRV